MSKSQFKLVVVGDGNVGKTSLLMTFANHKFPEEDSIPTIFENYVVNFKTGNNMTELDLWDTGGTSEYSRLRPIAYANANVLVICFVVVNPISYENVTSKWYPEVMHYLSEVPIILVGTKVDLRKDEKILELLRQSNQQPVTHSQGQELARKIKAVKYLECSARTQENLKTVFEEALKRKRVIVSYF
eukprot:TRINITY_DN4396_c0_g1_i1.p1 TRINITY_DN4396_c0_g1~~TRINITY_DN4396_c0_g1_i1.p1  ORF type:complete len:187 (+),score=22.32 TRINITY_DN4396_c0_g1_i1:50-610(+)